MKNRLLDYLPAVAKKGHPLNLDLERLGSQVHKQFDDQLSQAQTSIQEHPLPAIGAALCLGVVLGWIVKRR